MRFPTFLACMLGLLKLLALQCAFANWLVNPGSIVAAMYQGAEAGLSLLLATALLQGALPNAQGHRALSASQCFAGAAICAVSVLAAWLVSDVLSGYAVLDEPATELLGMVALLYLATVAAFASAGFDGRVETGQHVVQRP